MSGAMNEAGLIGAFAGAVGSALSALNMGWVAVFGILHTVFFLLHYLFASQTAHIGALYTAFLAMMLAAGVPPILAAVTLGYNGNLFGSLTHYSSGQAAIYYGSGYMTLKEVFTFGALMGLRHLVTWGFIGMAWWKYLGWW
jgi:DASS family divalent anion:Na+ symporter